MSTLTMAPQLRIDHDDDEPGLLVPQFELSTAGDLGADDAERVRYDEQILAALVSP